MNTHTSNEIEIGNSKSGRKLAKKARQIYRRDQQATVRETATKVGKMLGNIVKPKPKYIPMKLWIWMMGFFIEVKRTPTRKT